MRTVLALGLVLATSVPARADDASLERLHEAAVRSPRDVDALVAYGRALVRAGRYDEARRTYHSATRLRRDSLELLYAEASVSFAALDYRATRTACAPLERAAPNAALTHICEARALLTLHRSASAFDELALARGAAPDSYEVALAYGDAYRLRMEADEAEEAYRRARALAPTEAAPHLGLGRLFATTGAREPAIASLERALTLDPDSPEVEVELGSLLGGQRGRDLLVAAVATRPRWAVAENALGVVELALANYDAAKAAFERALAADPRLAEASAGLGRALAHLPGHEAEAERVLVRALAVLPTDALGWATLAMLYARTERYEEAYESYRRAGDANPADATPLLDAVKLALSQHRDVLAAAYLDRVLSSRPDDGDALLLYGDVMRLRDDRAAARQYYERARQRLATRTAEVDARLRALDTQAR